MAQEVRVLLVTTWDIPCGIAEHSAMLKEAVEASDEGIVIRPCTVLDPAALEEVLTRSCHVVHLNYQAALHSRWTADWIHAYRQQGKKVLVTYHDTGVPNSEQCQSLVHAADATVVHEPFVDLPASKTRYWRMGVPGWHRPLAQPAIDDRPWLGTIGFPFGWKCYTRLCEVAVEAGWAVYLIAPNATTAQIAEWEAIGLHVQVRAEFVPRRKAVALLAGCDATAFTYVTHNTGQSGALLLGIAARKPVIALSTCRQFRALYADPLGRSAINWCETFQEVSNTLHAIPIGRCDPSIVALAEQESWTHLGKQYAALYRELAG